MLDIFIVAGVVVVLVVVVLVSHLHTSHAERHISRAFIIASPERGNKNGSPEPGLEQLGHMADRQAGCFQSDASGLIRASRKGALSGAGRIALSGGWASADGLWSTLYTRDRKRSLRASSVLVSIRLEL